MSLHPHLAALRATCIAGALGAELRATCFAAALLAASSGATLAQSSSASASSTIAPASIAKAQAPFDHVIVISVDGLRSDALIAGPPSDLPNFHRLMDCASTLNARTDKDYTVTLPNHTGMLTGRGVLGKDGHGWIENDDPAPGVDLHSNHGSYVASMFDVAHDNGLATGLFVGKTKFSLYDVSYDATHGAPDTTGADNGRDKLDTFTFADKTAGATDGVLAALHDGAPRSLFFLHFAVTDLTAHFAGWDVTRGSKYLKAVAAVDVELGRLLDAIGASESLRGKTAILLTADHGGGAPFKSHDQPQMWVDYVIPFLVWTGEDGAKLDLYELNATTRHDPSLTNPSYTAPIPPIRNADAANLALNLLGLPPVSGSTINVKQDLLVQAHRSND